MFNGSILLSLFNIHTVEVNYIIKSQSFPLVEQWSRMRPIVCISADPNCLFLNNVQRLNTNFVRIAPCFTAVIQIRQDERTI